MCKGTSVDGVSLILLFCRRNISGISVDARMLATGTARATRNAFSLLMRVVFVFDNLRVISKLFVKEYVSGVRV